MFHEDWHNELNLASHISVKCLKSPRFQLNATLHFHEEIVKFFLIFGPFKNKNCIGNAKFKKSNLTYGTLKNK